MERRVGIQVSQQPVEDLRARLERERAEADRLYNDALSAVDRAIQSAPAWPEAPASFDAQKVADINRAWDILPSGAPPVGGSLKGRLRAFIWRLVGPPLETQKQFNASLVDHLNRNAQAQATLPRTVAATLAELRRQFDALAHFQSLLVQYLQTITVYIDSKDRMLANGDLRERLAIAEQRLVALRRDIEIPTDRARSSAQPTASGTAVEAAAYVGFEDRFRGPETEIRRRVGDYLPILSGASDVVDIGCGRGELLELLKAHGVTARGVDSNPAMVELCRTRGLDVERGDALAFLEKQRDGAIGGLVAIQVVEHFDPRYLVRFLQEAHQKMRPGAPLILETINPACWMAFFETYIRDLTHKQPLHPETLRYLVQASGFQSADIQFRQPVGAGDKLEHVPSMPVPELASLAAAINDHADKLNARLFSWMDYVVVARR